LTIEETERISWEKVFEMFEVNGAGGGGCGEKLPLY
jgi:hypothetical protein